MSLKKISLSLFGLTLCVSLWGIGGHAFAASITVDDTSSLGSPATCSLTSAIRAANTNAAVDHDCLIGDYAHVGPGVSLAGNVTVGEGAFLGIGSVAIMGSTIGRWSTVGAGAAVVHDIPDNVTAVGLPARIIKRKLEV